MPRLYRPHIPIKVRCRVLMRQLGELWPDRAIADNRGALGFMREQLEARLAGILGCTISDLRLDHVPALALRKRRREGRRTVYTPAANDPEFLMYREKRAHEIKTLVRGDGAQFCDRALIKRAKKRDRKTTRARFRPTSSKFPKRAAQLKRITQKRRWPKRHFTSSVNKSAPKVKRRQLPLPPRRTTRASLSRLLLSLRTPIPEAAIMIDRQGTRIVIECDCCDETVASIGGEEWSSFWPRAREEGWRSRKIGAEWVHGCPEAREGDMSKLTLDAEGRPVRGFDVIYPPGPQAFEYAPLATNPYKGCGHGCAYCYVPLATHQKRAEFDAGAVPRERYVNRLIDDARRYQAAGVRDQVLLCFSTDPYHPGDTMATRCALQVLALHDLAFCTLTKGGERSIRDCDLFRPHRDAYAATLTSLDDAFSLKWERHAALPAERIATLATFHSRGIFTWVSIEPTLDAEHSLAVIRETHSFVDLFKIGKANYLGEFGKRIDWRDYTLRVVDLCQRLGAKHYIKRDLQGFLPEGYSNPLRIPQHH